MNINKIQQGKMYYVKGYDKPFTVTGFKKNSNVVFMQNSEQSIVVPISRILRAYIVTWVDRFINWVVSKLIK